MKRYKIEAPLWGEFELITAQSDNGEWVRWEDVRALIEEFDCGHCGHGDCVIEEILDKLDGTYDRDQHERRSERVAR